jgi:serine/threonine protein kinase
MAMLAVDDARCASTDAPAPAPLIQPVTNFLGRGSFGKVVAFTHLGLSYALKLSNVAGELQRRVAENECAVLRHLCLDGGHENVVRLLDYWMTDKSEICILMEHGGSDALTSGGNFPTEAIFWQMLQGVRFLHRRLVVHLDIKVENFTIDGTGRVRLIDFGLSRVLAASEVGKPTFTGFVGSPTYAAPEVHTACASRPFEGTAVDIWALGVVLFALAFQRFPFDYEEPYSTCKSVQDFGARQQLGEAPYDALCNTLPIRAQKCSAWIAAMFDVTLHISPLGRYSELPR